MSTIIVDADTSRAEAKIVDVEARTVQAANRQVATINRASELSLLTLTAIGVSVDATFRIQAFAIRTAINTFIQTRAALTIGNPLLAAETLVTGGIMLILLYEQLQAIEEGRGEANVQLSAAYSALRSAGGVYL